MQNLNNFKQLLIAKNIAATATADTTVASPSTLADGEVAVVTMDGVVRNESSTFTGIDYVRVVQGQGATKPLIVSPPIPKTAVGRAKAYAAPVQQVSYIGYNSGTTGTGSFDALSNMGLASPMVRTTFKSMYAQYADKFMEALSGYAPTASDTISTFVDKVTAAILNEVKRYVYVPYKVERVNSLAAGSVTALTGTATVLNFTKGSTLVTIDGTITNSGLVGSYIRVGSTAVTSPVYKITAYTASTSITLDQPFQGDSVTGLAVASAPLISPVTTTGTAGAGWGIRLTGLNQTKFRENVYRQETQNWITTVQNMGSTTVSDYVKATEGHGTYEQIAEEEVFFLFSEGFADNVSIQIPNIEYRKNALSTGTYGSIEINWKDVVYNTTSIADTAASFKQLKIVGDSAGGYNANSCFYDANQSGNHDVYSTLNAFLTTDIVGTP
jgi:hypothetical protein